MSSTGVADVPPAERSFLVRAGIAPSDVAIMFAVVAIVVAFAPPLTFEGWTPRFAIVIAFLPLGVLQLATDVAGRDAPARWMSAVLLAATVSALVSGQLRTAVVGIVGRDLSLISIAGCAGMWALARRSSPRGRVALIWVALGALTVNCVVAVLQVVLGIRHGALALYAGRPYGLSVNPVYLGAVASALALGAATVDIGGSRQRWAVHGMAIAGGAAAVLSGSRVAAAAIVVVIVGAALMRRAPLTRVLAVAAGMALGAVLGRAFDTSDSVSRATALEGGGRLQAWTYGLRAWLDRPVFGWGFGRFRSSVQHRFSLEFVRDNALDETRQAWFDPHNVVILLLTGVGVVGTVLVVGWLVSVARRARGPLVWMVAPVVLTWMLQPVALATLPLAMLLLGASMPLAADEVVVQEDEVVAPELVETEVPAPSRPRWRTVAGALGLAAAAVVLIGDAGFSVAVRNEDPDAAAGWSRWLLWRDPVVADAVAQLYSFDSVEPGAEELRWREAATDADPERPLWWTNLAYAYGAAGDLSRAEQAFERARDLQPTNARVIRLDAVIAFEVRDRERFERAVTQGCELGLDLCELDYDEQLALDT